jgi:hypothetical protein
MPPFMRVSWEARSGFNDQSLQPSAGSRLFARIALMSVRSASPVFTNERKRPR